MKYEILLSSEKSPKLLHEKPSKDGLYTHYKCGIFFCGTWASRLEQHKKFVNTRLGKYIIKLEQP